MDWAAVEAKVNAFVTNSLGDDKYGINKKLDEYANKFKIDKAFIVLVLSLLPILLVVLLGYSGFVIDLIGFVYPLYCSIKAIESSDADDDQQWLTYWLIFGAFKVFESITDFLISFIPFYFVLKIAFLIWCYYPTTLGAGKIYAVVFKKYIVPYIPMKEISLNVGNKSAETPVPVESKKDI